MTKLLRSVLIGQMVLLDDAEVIAEAEKRFARHVEGGEQIPADFRLAVYRAILHSGSRSAFESMLKMYREASLHEVHFTTESKCYLRYRNLTNDLCLFYRRRTASPSRWVALKTKLY